MRTKILILLAAMFGVFSACNDEAIIKSPQPTQGGIYLNPVGSKVITRASSSEYEEGHIYNAYVMLFKLSNGETDESNAEIVGRWNVSGEDLGFDQVNGYKFNTYITAQFMEKFAEEDNFFFASVSNFGEYNSIMKLDEDELEGLQTYADLEDIRVEMREGTFSYERGSNFLMSGRSDGLMDKDRMEAILLDPSAESNSVNIKLKRVDSKVRFHLDISELKKAYEETSVVSNVGIVLNRWRIHNLPTTTVLIESAKQNEYPTTSPPLYTSDWSNFEGQGEHFNEELSFYVLPQAFLRGAAGTESTNGKYRSITDMTDTAEKLGVNSDGTDAFAGNKETNNPLARMSFALRKEAADELTTPSTDPKTSALRKLRFGLRDVQHKIALNGSDAEGYSGGGLLKNEQYTIAPKDAPYVEFEGRMTYTAPPYDKDGKFQMGKPAVMHITDVRYTIHLGYAGIDDIYTAKEKAELELEEYDIPEHDDYFTRRNVYYDYNAWITGANDIRMEVNSYEGLTDPKGENPYEENAPGAEGTLLETSKYFRASSANNQHSFDLDLTKLAGGGTVIEDFSHITWLTMTPYGSQIDLNPMGKTGAIPGREGAEYSPRETMSVADHNWVKFRLNKIKGHDYTSSASGGTESGESLTDMRVFLGEREAPLDYYSPAAGNTTEVYTRNFSPMPADEDRYGYYNNEFNFDTVGAVKAYIRDYWKGEDLMLNPRHIVQMLIVVFNNKASFASAEFLPPMNKDNMNSFKITSYVEEYYYDRVPIGANAGMATFNSSSELNRFIGAEDRRFAFISDFNYSHDTESMMANAYLVIDQASIQTPYDPAALGSAIDQSDWSNNDILSYVGADADVYGNGSGLIAFGIDGTRKHLDRNNDGNDNDPFKTHPNLHSGAYPLLGGLATNMNSGLQNSQRIALTSFGKSVMSPDNTLDWSEVINMDNWVINGQDGKGRQNAALFQFLLSNRDEDGDGKIDLSEIKWYLPASNQIVYAEVGKHGMSTESHLFNPIDRENYAYTSKWGNGYLRAFISSTISSDHGSYYITWKGGSGNTQTYENNEPYTNGGVAEAMSHSFRNIAIPIPPTKTTPKGQISYPEDRKYYGVNLTTINKSGTMKYGGGVTAPLTPTIMTEYVPPVLMSERKAISDGGDVKYAYEVHAKYLNTNVFRNFIQEHELPLHNYYSTTNRIRKKFQIMSFEGMETTAFSKMKTNQNKTYKQYCENIADYDPDNDPCPAGWRSPCNAELVLYLSLKPNTNKDDMQVPSKYDWWGEKTSALLFVTRTYYAKKYGENENDIVYGLINPGGGKPIVDVLNSTTAGLPDEGHLPGDGSRPFYALRQHQLDDGLYYILPVRDIE